MASGIDWTSSPTQMARRVDDYGRRLLAAVYALAQEWASRLEAAMKANAPWQDRTGLARRTLFGRVFRIAAGAVLVIGGRAPYQQYLERRWGGRYAIIAPTLQQNYGPIMASLQRLVR